LLSVFNRNTAARNIRSLLILFSELCSNARYPNLYGMLLVWRTKYQTSSCIHAAEMLNVAVSRDTVIQSAADADHMALANIVLSAVDVAKSSVNIQRGTGVIQIPSVNIIQRSVGILHRLYDSMCRKSSALDWFVSFTVLQTGYMWRPLMSFIVSHMWSM
jgi:hypothetical protein